MTATGVWWRTSPYLREPEPVDVVGEKAKSITIQYAGLRSGGPAFSRTVRKESGGGRYFNNWREAVDHMLALEKQKRACKLEQVGHSDARISHLGNLSDPTTVGAK